MARSSQDPPAPISRRKTVHIEAKDRFLYNTSSRDSRARTVDNTNRYDSTSKQYDSHRRDIISHKPRYSDSIVPLKDDSSYSRRDARSTTLHQQAEMKATSTLTRGFKPQVSLSNMFEEEEHHDAQKDPQDQHGRQGTHLISHHQLSRNALNVARETHIKPAQGRLRSLSDTSIYSRPDPATFHAELPNRSSKTVAYTQDLGRDDDEVSVEYVNDDDDDYTKTNDKTQVLQGGGNDGLKTGKRDDGIEIPSSDELTINGNNTIGLTEFARLEKKISVKHSEMKEKTLVELAEPLITDVTQVYEQEWDAAIIAEEVLYKQIARSLGSLLDREMLAAAYGIRKDTAKISGYRNAAEKSITIEAQSAKRNISEILAEQKGLLLGLRELEERAVGRDAKILEDIRGIHDKYAIKRQKLEDEYGHKADALEDKIEALKNGKLLMNGFTEYVNKFHATLRNHPPSTKQKGTKRAQTRG